MKKNRVIKIEDAPKEIRESFQFATGLPIGYVMDYVRTFHKDGSETRVEYQKVSETELEILRVYNYS